MSLAIELSPVSSGEKTATLGATTIERLAMPTAEFIQTREINLGLLAQIPVGEGRQFHVSGQDVAVFRLRSGKLFATQAHCPHRAGPLADGLTGGATLACPLHGWKFNLETGEPIQGSCAIATYPVRVNDGGEVIIRVE